jgi:uncharacterized SAM-binding protein YcdF (DUF218 family)
MRINFKTQMGVFYLTVGILFLINGILTKIFSVTFSSFFLALSLPLIGLGLFEIIILKKHSSKLIKKLIFLIHLATFIIFISFIALEAAIIHSGFKVDITKPDYIVILGAGLHGETPSHALSKRLEKSLNIINLHKDVKIIVSGGQGPGESITEAEAMKKFLVAHGVSPDRIIKEDKSTNTLENINFTKNTIASLDNKSTHSITIITNNFHMCRSKLLAKRFGFSTYGYPAEIHPGLMPTYFIREYIALGKSLVFDFPK